MNGDCKREPALQCELGTLERVATEQEEIVKTLEGRLGWVCRGLGPCVAENNPEEQVQSEAAQKLHGLADRFRVNSNVLSGILDRLEV